MDGLLDTTMGEAVHAVGDCQRDYMTLHHGDCLDVMATMDPESVDAIVTDPPYGLGFMGKAWDHGVPARAFWEAMLRVAKPSSYLLSFGGTRTVHRIATNIEDAGWIIRDTLVWGYASGFPKSKASLKPAWEPIVMARKPGPLRELAIDACRIPMSSEDAETIERAGGFMQAGWQGPDTGIYNKSGDVTVGVTVQAGRWPANIILTDPIFDGGWEGVVGGGETRGAVSNSSPTGKEALIYGAYPARPDIIPSYGDSGTYSRFFLIPKADRADREPVLGGTAERVVSVWDGDEDDLTLGKKSTIPRRNVHPTVKPTDLMRHLVRLVTPADGIVLDPFLGSGTTALAAEMEGFGWIGIEKEAEYVAIAEARLNGVQQGLGLVG